MQYQQNIYVIYTQAIPRVSVCCTQYLKNIYLISIQYLKNIYAGHGPTTGRCVPSDRLPLAEAGVTVCEIQSWCPTEDDRLVKGELALVSTRYSSS